MLSSKNHANAFSSIQRPCGAVVSRSRPLWLGDFWALKVTFISAFSISHSFLSRSNRRHSDWRNWSTLGKAYSATVGACGVND